MADPTPFLAIWGAVTSTVLFGLKIREHRHGLIRQVRVSARSDPPHEVLEVFVCNAGPRPLTIARVDVVYGSSPRTGQKVASITPESPVKLQESDPWMVTASREQLLETAGARAVSRANYCRVWVSVEPTTGSPVFAAAEIASSIIENPYDPNAAHWIAADVFLGFPQQSGEGSGLPPMAVLIK
jgi:hypothetical protein